LAALADVLRLMEESQASLKDGRVEDFNRLHKQIVGQLSSDNCNWFLATIIIDRWRQLEIDHHFQGVESLFFA